MPITDKLLFNRMIGAIDTLSLCVQAGVELPAETVNRLRDAVNHACMPATFVADNADYFITAVSQLCDYVDTLQRPHALIRTGVASPAMMIAHKRGELKDKGIALLPPHVGIMACYDDAQQLRYYSVSTNEAS